MGFLGVVMYGHGNTRRNYSETAVFLSELRNPDHGSHAGVTNKSHPKASIRSFTWFDALYPNHPNVVATIHTHRWRRTESINWIIKLFVGDPNPEPRPGQTGSQLGYELTCLHHPIPRHNNDNKRSRSESSAHSKQASSEGKREVDLLERSDKKKT